VYENLPTGLPEIDTQTGGLPRGAITEIFGPACSGRTSILLTILAEASRRDEVLALVDGVDAFDPASGALTGLDLRRLLWVRCRNLDQVLRSTDLLLHGGGFGIVAMDVTDIPPRQLHAVPPAAWFRFQRTIEKTPTSLVILGRESAAKSAASLALRLGDRAERAGWAGWARWAAWASRARKTPPHTVLLRPSRSKAEIVRLREQMRVRSVLDRTRT
jgi:hypothetical protein